MKTATQLLNIMSPCTLASLVADLQSFAGADKEELALLSSARQMLISQVGEEEATVLIADATE